MAQCAFQGEFQKLTTLMAAGPKAARLQALSWAQCQHTRHEHRARGRTCDGSSEAARSAAYPPFFNATMAWLLFGEGLACPAVLHAACNGAAAHALHATMMSIREVNRRAARDFCVMG